eukprot:88870-Amphidinium_carterae.1
MAADLLAGILVAVTNNIRCQGGKKQSIRKAPQILIIKHRITNAMTTTTTDQSILCQSVSLPCGPGALKDMVARLQ